MKSDKLVGPSIWVDGIGFLIKKSETTKNIVASLDEMNKKSKLPTNAQARAKFIEENSIGDVREYKPGFPKEYYVKRSK